MLFKLYKLIVEINFSFLVIVMIVNVQTKLRKLSIFYVIFKCLHRIITLQFCTHVPYYSVLEIFKTQSMTSLLTIKIIVKL